MPGHPGPAEQLASRATLFFLDADHSDPAKNAMKSCILRAPAQHIRKG